RTERDDQHRERTRSKQTVAQLRSRQQRFVAILHGEHCPAEAGIGREPLLSGPRLERRLAACQRPTVAEAGACLPGPPETSAFDGASPLTPCFIVPLIAFLNQLSPATLRPTSVLVAANGLPLRSTLLAATIWPWASATTINL